MAPGAPSRQVGLQVPNCWRSAVMDLVQSDNCLCRESGVRTQLRFPTPQSSGTGVAAPAEPPRGGRELCQPPTPLSDRHRYPGAPQFLLQAPEQMKRHSTSSTWDRDVAAPELRVGVSSHTPGLARTGQHWHGGSTIPGCRITPVRGISDSSRTLPNLWFN